LIVAQVGNINALKDGRSKDHARYMKDYRKEKVGRVPDRPVGRPRRVVEKGDIFEVAARLHTGLKLMVQAEERLLTGYVPPQARKALQAYQDYWEKD
jgi:hypothetical protein